MEVSQVKQLKDLEKELAQDKKIVAGLTLQNTVLKDVLSITADTSLPSQRVIRELEMLVDWPVGRIRSVLITVRNLYLPLSRSGVKITESAGLIFNQVNPHRTA